MHNFQGLINNKVEFPRETEKNSCEIASTLDFLALKFPRDVTYIVLPTFQRWSFVLPEIPRGIGKNKKNPGFFSKKYLPKPPCLFAFSGIAVSKTIDLNWSYEALAQKEALTLCQDRVFAPFSCVLSLASVLARFTNLYCDTGSSGKGAPLHGK